MLLLALASLLGAAPPAFDARQAPVSEELARTMEGKSWRAGCPVGPAELALLELTHWGYDGEVHRGRLIVHREIAAEVVEIFRALFAARFPIERMRPVDAYGGDDEASMADNNTSGFNCREVTGRPGRWSRHAYGRAIDLNPRTNPYVLADGTVLPPAGRAHLARAPAPGLVAAGGAVVREFTRRGWAWGGSWRTVKDYQHFECR